MAGQMRKYLKEFKLEVINVALKSPFITSTATDLGIPESIFEYIEVYYNRISPTF
jgi:hypothetical protein